MTAWKNITELTFTYQKFKMALEKRVLHAYLFPNGNLATFDFGGSQIPELQGQYSIETHKRILLEARDDCEFKGFGMLPPSFTVTAKEWADYWRNKNMGFDDIQKL